MKITIHQALCGENPKKAWDLLKTTFPDVNIAKNLAFRTGLQDDTQGVQWQPAIRGFAEGDYFLFIKTFPDRSPDVRQGRAFSHVLIIPKKEATTLHDLNPIFAVFPEQMDKEAQITPVVINDAVPGEMEFDVPFKQRFNKVIHGYVNHLKYQNTIVWIGQAQMPQIVNELWKRLSEDERSKFNFGIYFNTDNIDTSRLNLIAIPEAVQSKFFSSGYLLVNKDETYTPATLAEQIFSGSEDAKKRVDSFMNNLEMSSIGRTDLDKIAIGLKTFEDLETTTDLKRINTLCHIIAEYSPASEKGTAYKEKVIERVIKLIDNSAYNDLQVLRNFKVESFDKSQLRISKALANWLERNVFNNKNGHENNGFLILKVIAGNTKLNWFGSVLQRELKDFLKELSPESAKTLWYWFMNAPELFTVLYPYLEKGHQSENSLIISLPKKLDPTLLTAVKEFALKRSWYKLYGYLLLKTLTPLKALSEQLKIDKNLSFFDGIKAITDELTPNLLLDFTIKQSDPRLIKISAENCLITPSLLEAIDFKIRTWQEIWMIYFQSVASFTAAFKHPQKKVDGVLNDIISGNSIPEEILNQIAQSEFGNLLHFRNRKALWGKLSAQPRDLFLRKTSANLLEELSKNPNTEVPEDEVLSNFILQHGISDFLYYNSNKIKNTLPIFVRYNNIPLYYLRDYLRNYTGDINTIEAKQLGKLIYNRDYQEVASVIYHKANKNNNWKFALAECHSILDIWTKAKLAFQDILSNVNIPSDEWWEVTEEFIVNYYSNGNALHTLWKKAGGKEYDLVMNGTAQEAWHSALLKIRHGMLKQPFMNDLLKEINKDYGHIEKFKLIYNLRKSFIRRK